MVKEDYEEDYEHIYEKDIMDYYIEDIQSTDEDLMSKLFFPLVIWAIYITLSLGCILGYIGDIIGLILGGVSPFIVVSLYRKYLEDIETAFNKRIIKDFQVKNIRREEYSIKSLLGFMIKHDKIIRYVFDNKYYLYGDNFNIHIINSKSNNIRVTFATFVFSENKKYKNIPYKYDIDKRYLNIKNKELFCDIYIPELLYENTLVKKYNLSKYNKIEEKENKLKDIFANCNRKKYNILNESRVHYSIFNKTFNKKIYYIY